MSLQLVVKFDYFVNTVVLIVRQVDELLEVVAHEGDDVLSSADL